MDRKHTATLPISEFVSDLAVIQDYYAKLLKDLKAAHPNVSDTGLKVEPDAKFYQERGCNLATSSLNVGNTIYNVNIRAFPDSQVKPEAADAVYWLEIDNKKSKGNFCADFQIGFYDRDANGRIMPRERHEEVNFIWCDTHSDITREDMIKMAPAPIRLMTRPARVEVTNAFAPGPFRCFQPLSIRQLRRHVHRHANAA